MSALAFDLNHCCVSDPSPLSNESEVVAVTERNVNELLSRLRTISSSDSNVGMVINLSTATPVEKLPYICSPPEPREPTKWEKYAKSKRLNRSKRSRLEYNEATGDWAPRWGSKSAKNDAARKDWVREAKPGESGANPFEVSSIERGIAKTKANIRQARNQMRDRKH